MSDQTLTVIYNDEISQCEYCNKQEASNGSIVSLDECKHTFHICCLIHHSSEHGIKCPICNTKINDMRLSIAVSFKRNSLQELISTLEYF